MSTLYITFYLTSYLCSCLSIKAESHCSDNKNDNNHDAKRTHSIGWIVPRRISARSFNQWRACIVNVLVFFLVIEASVTVPQVG